MNYTKKDLIEIQEGKTIDYLYQDGGLLLTKAQTEFETQGFRAYNRNFFIAAILHIVEKCVLDEMSVLDELNKNFHKKHSTLAKLYSKGSLDSRFLAEHIEPIVDEAKKLMEDEKVYNVTKKIKNKLKDFAENHIFGKGLIRTARNLVKKSDIGKYEQDYVIFTKGCLQRSIKGEEFWQIGWNEAQAIIKSEISELTQNLASFGDRIDKLIESSEGLNASNLDEKDKAKLKEIKNSIEQEYNQYDKTSASLYEWQMLYRAVEHFRNDDRLFEEKLWKPFVEKYNKKQLEDGREINMLTPIQANVKSPLIDIENDIAEPFEVRFISAGIKSEESVRRKMSGKGYDGKLDNIFDLVRFSASISNDTGIDLLLANIKDIAAKNKYPVVTSEELYESYLYSIKINRAVSIKLGDNSELEVVGEEKILPEKLLEVKRLFNDKIYDFRRLMKPEDADGNREIIDVEDRKNESTIRGIHSEIKTFLQDDRIKDVIKKFRFSFGEFNINNLDEFKQKDNFTKVYDKLTDLERCINIDAINKSEKSIRRRIYTQALKELSKENAKFTMEDLTKLSQALHEGDLETFLKNSKFKEAFEIASEKIPGIEKGFKVWASFGIEGGASLLQRMA